MSIVIKMNLVIQNDAFRFFRKDTISFNAVADRPASTVTKIAAILIDVFLLRTVGSEEEGTTSSLVVVTDTPERFSNASYPVALRIPIYVSSWSVDSNADVTY
jgi:hypothetical protein